MYLTRIEMNGFKSFHTKKEILIKKGITGVVGPNGCGKSNIADAIRWVLGEQSAKNLRGTNMGDVIFNGTDSIPKKGYCEVELTFDNSDGRVKSDYSEVSVKRKLYRSGESEYYINGSICRLKDLVELFRDTGIGKEGYSIIGQGRIDEILNSKPNERVRVFEEAAGVMKYRVKKEEAERNLSKTKANLLRLEDIIYELETQVEPLREQMDVAKQFITLKEELKNLEINLYLYNHDHNRDRTARLQAQQTENAEESEDNARLIETLGREISELKTRADEIQKTLEINHREISDRSQEREKLRGEYNLILEKENNYSQQKRDLDASVSDNDARIAEGESSLKTLKSELEELNGEIDRYTGRIRDLETKRDESRESARDFAVSADDVRAEFESVREKFEEAKRVCAQYETKAELLAENMRKYESDGEELEARKTAAEDSLNEKNRQIEKASEEQSSLLSEANGLNAQRRETREKLDAVREELNEYKSSLAQKRSSEALLLDLKDSYEGYATGIKSLFAKGGGMSFSGGLIGTVADLIKVPKEYETALESVLGNALQDVVVKNESTAKQAIEYLRKNRSGRVTFLPIDTMKVRYFSNDETEDFLGMRGVRGVASSLVKCSDEIRPAVDFLLSRTVVVDDLDNAFAFMKKTGYSIKAVTEKGDILRPGGSVTGGSSDKQTKGFLARNRMIDELKSDIAVLGKKLEDTERLAAETDGKASELDEKHAAVLRKIEENGKAVIVLKSEAGSIESDLKSISERIEANAELIRNAGSEERQNKELYEKEKESLAGYESGYLRLSSELDKIETNVAELSSDTDRITDELQEASLYQKEMIGRKDRLLLQIDHVNAEILKSRKENEESGQKLDEITAQLDGGIEEDRKEILRKLDEAHSFIQSASEDVKKVYSEKEDIERQINEKTEQSAAANERANELIEQKYRLASQLDKIQLQSENQESRIWEDYNITYSNALPYKMEQFSVQSSSRRITEIKETLFNMGSVNPNAIEDYNRVSDRLEEMLVQKGDLEKASDDLISVITSLEKDMEVCFREKFLMINERFQNVFRELFGGGRASLELIEGESDADRGIDIIAEPPGKKLQRLTLLSGGEKALCAIALLFAMLDINPSPICLLDEIDAPLDDNNLYRFTDYLKKLSEELQFIVITHRKPTMSVCDTLYGIAMRKKGISEVLSVELN